MRGHNPPAIVVEIRYEHEDGRVVTDRYLATPDAGVPARLPGHVMWRFTAFDEALEPLPGTPIGVEAPGELSVWAVLWGLFHWHKADPGSVEHAARLHVDGSGR